MAMTGWWGSEVPKGGVTHLLSQFMATVPVAEYEAPGHAQG